MLDVFRLELPRIAQVPIEVTGLKVRPSRGRSALRDGRLNVVYRVRLRADGGPERECALLGTAPETGAFLAGEACQALRGHPALAPFREPALVLEDLRLALCIFPLDPALPALAELTGAHGAGLLAPHLSECRAGARIERVEHELRHYKPFKRAVLRITVTFGAQGPRPRALYAKLFRDDRGALLQREQSELWRAAKNLHALRMPEPLGYIAGRRVLLMGEAPGVPALIDWINCLESGIPLPAGVDLGRLERCMAVVAETLAELQATPIRPGARRSYARELARSAKDRELLRGEFGREFPELAARAENLLRRLEALAPAHEELRPAHGGFRHKQTVGNEHDLTLIDWDGLCLADPALDAGTFLLRLRREPLRSPGQAPALEHLAAGFRAQFLARAPHVTAERLALYEGLALTEGMLRCLRRAPKEHDMPALIRNLALAAEVELDRVQQGHPA